MHVACQNMNEMTESCLIGRRFPDDCRSCQAYIPGFNEPEKERGDVWRQARWWL